MKDEEHKIQVAGVALCRQVFQICQRLLYAVPNGGARNAITGRRLKDEGVLRGVFDLALDVQRRKNYEPEKSKIGDWRTIVYSGLKIEVKTPKAYAKKNHGLSKEQQQYQMSVEEQGYRTAVVCSAQQLFDVVREYLDGIKG